MSIKNSKTKLGLWLSTFISMAGLLLIVLIAYLFEKTISPNFNRTLQTIISVIIAIIPPLLWLTIFYRQDRLNPEPKSFVFKTMLLGALVQKAIYSPLVSIVLLGGSSGITYIGSKLIVNIILIAIIQESIKLISVRYSIYPSKEFDEVIDGIIYGSALGLGFAAMTSIDNIIASGGAMLTNVTALVVIETFAHASITGLSCYILGVSKYNEYSIVRLPLAVIIASTLNAITQFLLNTVVRRGFKINYILGLIPAALVAFIVFGVLVFLSSKHEKEAANIVRTSIDPRKALTGMIPVWIILGVTLCVGILTGNAALKNEVYTVDNFIEIQYPPKWIQSRSGEELFKAADIDIASGTNFVSVRKISLDSLMNVEAKTEEEKLQNAAAAWSIKAGMDYRFYQAENGYYHDTKGKETYIINYVYISNRQSASADINKPDIGYGKDVLSIVNNDLYIITLSSSYENFVLNDNKLIDVSYTFNMN
ncbi:MAG: PrsW family intramembrane metalloprotease [Acetivibrionales bacterium]|jgi:RsiW-degrading membrane proteinase PrsW (M82 family)